MTQVEIANLRQEYSAKTLDLQDATDTPYELFGTWFKEAVNSEILEPNAMVLSTVTTDQRATGRVCLLKGFTEKGFVFYTNYTSRKGEELAANPHGCMTFNWLELQRQVRIEGTVQKVSPEEATEYFQSRPRGSQIGAWASDQSAIIDSRKVLEAKVEELEHQYEGAEVLPRPEHWGGYLLVPTLIEFWQGRQSRLHDRLQYTLAGDGDSIQWKVDRLAP